MRVLALGLCETGTESLMEALRILGYNEAYHGWVALFNNPRDYAMWQRGLRAKYDGIGEAFGREEIDRLLGHWQAIWDIPGLCFSEELIKAYPEAKIILTVRDMDEWQWAITQRHYMESRTDQPYASRPIKSIFATSGKWRMKFLIVRFLLVRFLRIITLLCCSRFHWVSIALPRAGREILARKLQNEGRAIYESHYK
ncbi:hypothetical protein BJX96DRAFT_178920 [Aspergillus floccosus]